jgi:MFS superfamily sulfate permease-like transporter
MSDLHDHSDYVHGEMDIHQHQSTYALFGNLTKWGSLAVAVGLVFLVILTCVPGAGFMTAAIVAIILGVLGWVFLKKKPDAAH